MENNELLRRLALPEDRRIMIEQVVTEYKTVEHFREAAAIEPEFVISLRTELFRLLIEWCYKELSKQWDQLINVIRWNQLAKDPKMFDSELDAVFSSIRTVMKKTYGIAAHRPTRMAARDAEIYKMRVEQNRSFGQIENKLKVPANVAERAFNRYPKQQEQQLRELLDFFSDALVVQSRKVQGD